jgi:hypothetical protein
MRLFALLLAFNATACADMMTFNVSGTLTDGAVLGGTITVNEVAGAVTAVSITVGAPDSLTMSVIDADRPIGGPLPLWLLVPGVAPVGTYPELGLILPTSTLVGYDGGPLCTNSNGRSAECYGFASDLTNGVTVVASFESGSLTPVPEPSSMWLLESALAGLAVFGRRHAIRYLKP